MKYLREDLTQLKERKREYINSFLIACLIEVNMLCWIFANISNIIVILTAFFGIIYLINNKSKLKLNNLKCCVFLFIFMIFLLNIIFYGMENKYLINYFLFFIMFSVSAFVFTENVFNFSMIYEWLMLLGWIVIPKLLYQKAYIVDFTKNDFYGYLMGLSYGILPCFLATLYIITHKKSYKKIIHILSIILAILITYMYIRMSSRGTLISVVVYIIFLILMKQKNNAKKILLSSSIFILTIITYVYFKELINILEGILYNIGINSVALDKIIQLESINELSNGRGDIWLMAFKDIGNSPVLGYGIGAFENKYGFGYVHNIIIQIMYEIGIPLTMLFIVFIIKRTITIIKNNQYDNKLFFIYLFCAGIIQLIFSGFLWGSIIFWIFIGYILTNNKIYKRKQ